VNIAITATGIALLEAIPSNLNKKLLNNLSEKEAGQLSDLLDKMR
jgi:DNA-binding MarR family transcriptional regulator